jgi:hydroxymethylpyrimidine/phosphomethylpyrimidine kinase
MKVARVLIIAGSDSGGGAGVQADIKTVMMLGGFATTAVTALTAQNTLGVDEVWLAPSSHVIAQIDAVVRDIGVDAMKIGMIGSANTAHAVADYLCEFQRLHPMVPLVFDPVMIATSGAVLADADTMEAFNLLIKLATVVTPNLPELEALGGASALRARAKFVLIKGGHGDGDIIIDRLIGPDGEVARWSDTRIDTRHTHGTGCTLASGIACGLGQGLGMIDAIGRARQFVRQALINAPGFGVGHGPMGHQAVRDL